MPMKQNKQKLLQQVFDHENKHVEIVHVYIRT